MLRVTPHLPSLFEMACILMLIIVMLGLLFAIYDIIYENQLFIRDEGILRLKQKVRGNGAHGFDT